MNLSEIFKEWFNRLVQKNPVSGRYTWYAVILIAFLKSYRFVQITIREFLDDRLFLRAMALTFGTLFSIIPMLVISFSMFNLFGGGEWFMDVLRPILSRYLAPGSEPVVSLRIEELLEGGRGTFVSGIGLIFLVIAVYGIFSAIVNTFNLIWGVNARISILSRLPLYWGMVTIIPILVISSLAFTTYLKALPLVHNAVESVGFAESLINKTLPVLMVILGFFLLYRFLPSTRVRSYAALAGAITAGLLYELIKSGFILYTGKLVKYDILYGSMAIIPSLMVWINLSWIVVLLGVEICFVTQHLDMLKTKRKHIEFSRAQKDALAYSILVQISLAFRGIRETVTVEEWSHKFGIPPGIVLEVIDKLRNGNLIKRAGSGGNILLLTRDPDYIKISEIDSILTGESLEEWSWPDYPNWQWLKNWIRLQNSNSEIRKNGITLGELIQNIENQDKHTEIP